MSFSIRPFTRDDYDPYAGVSSACMGQPITGETLRRDDEMRDPKYKVGRFIAEVGGRLVGYGEYAQNSWAYHPRKFSTEVAVLPEYRGAGIGTALYEQVMRALAPHEPLSLLTFAREDFPDGVRFAGQLGFTESMRNWESHLDLATADVTPHLPALGRAAELGYEIKSYPELEAIADRDRKIHAVMNRLRKDVPSVEPVSDIAFEEWAKGFQRREFWPEGYFLALKDGAIVGVHGLWQTDESAVLHNGLTAVDREHRGTGLTMALKLRGIEAARQAGYAKIKTWNESNNQPMLAINIKLGFARKPAWITYRLRLRAGE